LSVKGFVFAAVRLFDNINKVRARHSQTIEELKRRAEVQGKGP
jgi:hypothetical protein